VLAFARDVTARKELDRKLVEADRLNALGALAAGVAHEINNPLTYAQLSLQRVERTISKLGLPDQLADSVREQLHDVHHGIARVAAISASLRMFARADEAPPGPIDVASVIDRALKMVDNELRHRGQLVRRIDDVTFAIGNESRLEQVVVNLLLNAIHALPADGSGRIEISAATRDTGLAIAIRDTGSGIAAAVRDRVFEPFFTTKPTGEGMGIVESFGGTIELASVEGEGTTVTVHLRSSRMPAPAPAPVAVASPRRAVLIIDDDALVRSVLAQILQPHHEVSVADSGTTGLALASSRAFDAILCDMMMPVIDGREVHRRLASEHPGRERRIVFITGGAFGFELDHYLATVGNRCLTKPFRIEAVLEAVAEIASS
jgi:CheY-like chemotaxis protein